MTAFYFVAFVDVLNLGFLGSRAMQPTKKLSLSHGDATVCP